MATITVDTGKFLFTAAGKTQKQAFHALETGWINFCWDYWGEAYCLPLWSFKGFVEECELKVIEPSSGTTIQDGDCFVEGDVTIGTGQYQRVHLCAKVNSPPVDHWCGSGWHPVEGN